MVTRLLPRRRGAAAASRWWRVRSAADLGEQFVAHHVVAEVDGAGEAFGVGAAVALDDDAVEAEEDAAVRLARIHLLGRARGTRRRARR